jgi:site-specific DNA-cytosine methylase
MKFFSTFTGIGGFEIGIQNAYLRHLQQVALEAKAAIQALKTTAQRSDYAGIF